MAFPITELWAKEIQRNLDNNLVFKRIANTTYQGDVQQNGIVRVVSIGDIEIKDYSKNGELDTQRPEPTTNTMTIDRAKYFNFAIDDINQKQISLPVMQKYSLRTAVAMGSTVDKEIYEYGISRASTVIGTTNDPIVLNADNIVKQILTLETMLNNAKALRVGRFVTVSNEVGQLLKEVVFSKTTFSGNDTKAVGALIGRIGMFDVYESDIVRPDGGVVDILAGSGDFISFADQINKVEPYRPEKTFADAIKGLYVYGMKTFRGTEGAVLKATIA